MDCEGSEVALNVVTSVLTYGKQGKFDTEEGTVVTEARS